MEGCESGRWSNKPLQPRKSQGFICRTKAELQKQGVQFPIHLDYIVSQVDNSMVQQASSFKQSVESALGADNVVVDLQRFRMMISKISPISVIQQLREITISQAVVGPPDYQDPSTYLESISPVNGSVSYYFGIDAGTNNPAIAAVGFGPIRQHVKRCGCWNCWIKQNATKNMQQHKLG